MGPAPDGFVYILKQYLETKAAEWLSTGDSWMDDKAAAEAEIPFISYQGDVEQLLQRKVEPLAVISDIRELIQYVQ